MKVTKAILNKLNNPDMIWYDARNDVIVATTESDNGFFCDYGSHFYESDGCMCCHADKHKWILLEV